MIWSSARVLLRLLASWPNSSNDAHEVADALAASGLKVTKVRDAGIKGLLLNGANGGMPWELAENDLIIHRMLNRIR